VSKKSGKEQIASPNLITL